MPSIPELVPQFGGEQEAAYTAFRQVEVMVTRASAPGKEAEKAQLAAELAAELWAMTEAKKDDKGKEIRPEIRYPLVSRVKILRLLPYAAGDKEVPAIAKALDDLDLREGARCALDRHPAEQATKALIDALDSSAGPEFRVGIVGSLARRPSAQAMAALQKATSDVEPEVAMAAVEALANFPEPANDEFIVKATECKCPVASKRALKARVRFAESLSKSGAKFAAKKVYQSIASGAADPLRKKAAELALKGM
jgi:hypothetical protein